MRAQVLALVVAMAATPVFAKTAPKPVEPDHAGPIPYSELAAADAKMNGPMTKKHKVMHKKAAASASTAAAGTGADASAGAGASTK